jgi:trehalose 6-phosphate synthase
MSTLRLQLRFLLPLALVLVAAALVALPLMDRMTMRWFARDLDERGAMLADALSDSIERALDNPAAGGAPLQAVLDRTARDERLVAVAVCLDTGERMRSSAGFPSSLDCGSAKRLAQQEVPRYSLPSGTAHVAWRAIGSEKTPHAALVLLHDLGFIERRNADTRSQLVALIAGLGLAIALITIVVTQLSWRRWIKGAQALLSGGSELPVQRAPPGELAPVANELRARLRDLEDEFRRSLGVPSEWNADRLRALLSQQLRGDDVIVVSNREPYIHDKNDGGIIVRRPASGLVTALEPVMRACSGAWVAHGGGSADRDAVDKHDRVPVPPGAPQYTLRRVWLSEAEEQGYYYGFANEGMWPLCHIAHVRPVFRESDWAHYRQVNERFADAIAQEARGDDPVVLVQDYHFALLPALLRKRLPKATIITFWHIPWPNPESFGVCPWAREILEGLLGSSILGFHTRYHCKNFIETVDRYLEARIEHEHSTITYQEEETLVESYPISIAWPSPDEAAAMPTVAACRARVLARLHMPEQGRLAVGVDRFDYTKGIIERLNAVERLLEKYPQWIGIFRMLQVAAPTRARLDEYRDFHQRVERQVERINRRFGSTDYTPVELWAEHQEHDAVNELYRAADVCMVTSLHDGMNLVAKEFIAARDDERGVLVLSRFAGAARELREALIVNPYHVEETADALHRALAMPEAEQHERMASLRSVVRENNVYRWAGRMLIDAARWRLRERIEARVERFSEGPA